LVFIWLIKKSHLIILLYSLYFFVNFIFAFSISSYCYIWFILPFGGWCSGVDVNISTVSEEISNVIAACLSHLLQLLTPSWRDTCLNKLKTTLIIVFSSVVTDKTYPTIPLWCWISYWPLPHRKSFPYVSIWEQCLERHAFLNLSSMLLNIWLFRGQWTAKSVLIVHINVDNTTAYIDTVTIRLMIFALTLVLML